MSLYQRTWDVLMYRRDEMVWCTGEMRCSDVLARWDKKILVRMAINTYILSQLYISIEMNSNPFIIAHHFYIFIWQMPDYLFILIIYGLTSALLDTIVNNILGSQPPLYSGQENPSHTEAHFAFCFSLIFIFA